MATRARAPETGQTQLLSIDELQAKHRISAGVFAGACGTNGWKPGLCMTEAEFLAGIDRFKNAPMTGAKEATK